MILSLIKGVCARQGMNPAMQEMLGQFDMNSPELKEQLDSLGTSPDQVNLVY